jgi:hypothetical protein
MTVAKRLIGMWGIDPEDTEAVAVYGHTTLVFQEDGSLIYTILGETSDQVLDLSYLVDGDVIVTNQRSRPREERTQFCFAADGSLLLNYGGKNVRYVRLEEGDD